MKRTSMLIAVMLIPGITLFIGLSYNAKQKAANATPLCELILPKISVDQNKITSLPQPDHKEVILKQVVKKKPVKPFIVINKVEGDGAQCSEPALGEEADDVILNKVEIEAEYPGGAAAWQRFLNRNLRVPDDVIDNELNGSVLVQFVVDKEGNVSNVEAVSGQEAMCAEAVRVIKKSGRWMPAVQNGRYVKSLKKQPFVICFETEE